MIAARMKGCIPKSDSRNAHLNLTEIEEEVIVQYILDLDLRGFSPRIADVGDIANLLLRKRGARPVGINWSDCFVVQRPELKTHFNCIYNYQRALYKDPIIIEL